MTATPLRTDVDGRDQLHAETPPHAADAERAVLAAVMFDPAAIPDVADVLAAGDFYRPAHETIYAAILDLWRRHEVTDPIAVAAELDTAGTLAGVGGRQALVDIAGSATVGHVATHYAGIVRDRAHRRALAIAGQRITRMAYAGPEDTDERQNSAAVMVAEAERGSLTGTVQHFGAAALDDLADLDDPPEPGIASGYTDLDEAMSPGFERGGLGVIGARPGVGKTIVLGDVARHAAIKQGIPTLMFSLEMSRKQLTRRLLCAEGKVDQKHYRNRTLDDAALHRLARAGTALSSAPIFYDTRQGLTVAAIRSAVRSAVRDHGVQLVTVDYLQLIRPPAGDGDRPRYLVVDDLTRDLKLLAAECGVFVLTASQLSRSIDTRQDKTPTMGDLRESGGIEANADTVLMLADSDDHADEVNVYVAKHRDGEANGKVIPLGAQKHFGRFVNVARWSDTAPAS